jgi:hypothetical protein
MLVTASRRASASTVSSAAVRAALWERGLGDERDAGGVEGAARGLDLGGEAAGAIAADGLADLGERGAGGAFHIADLGCRAAGPVEAVQANVRRARP